jgi:hypothetical protein
MADLRFTPDEAARRAIDADLRLDGEDPNTSLVEDAVHWVKVYTELLAFKEHLLELSASDIGAMSELDARSDAATDEVLLEHQAGRYRRRLAEWKQRLGGLTASGSATSARTAR